MTTPSSRGRLVIAAVVGILLGVATSGAEASHFRSGIIQPTVDAPGVVSGDSVSFTVTWKITHSWRRSAYGNPNVHDIVHTGVLFNFGDGTTTSLVGEVTSINTVEDWIVLNSEFSRTYTSLAAVVTTVRPFFESCCRISTLQEGNGSAGFRVQGGLVLEGARASRPPPQNVPNQAPSVSSLPVISVIDAGNPTSSFVITASDPEGGPHNFAFAPKSDAVEPHSRLPRPVPSGLTINPSTGLATWDLTQLGSATGQGLRIPGNLFATQVIVKDSENNRIPTDFLMKLVTGTGLPPTLQVNGAAADLTLDVFTNTAVSFPIAASDPDADSLVTLTVAGLPAGATLTPSLPFTASAPGTTFNWTPTTPGTMTMTFAATDNVGFVTQRTATIRVTVPNRQPTIACPAPVALLPSVPQTLRVRVADVDGDALVVTWSINGVLHETDNVAAGRAPVHVRFTHAYASGNYTVTVAATDGIALSATCSIAVTVAYPASSLQFSAAVSTAGEGSGSATITVLRTGSTLALVTVDYATVAATSGVPAAAGADYTAVSGTLTFRAGVTTRRFKVPIIDDTDVEGTERLNLVLRNPTGGASLVTPSTAALRIVDNDSTVPLAPTYTYAEGAGATSIPVVRTGSLSTPGTVRYTVAGGTATAGVDYVAAATGILSFPSGVARRSVPITILQDTLSEGPETVSVVLSNPTGGVHLGAISSTVLTIADDDAAGRVAFSTAVYAAAEGGPAAIITVVRSGGAASGVTVQYATSDGTATAGIDYTATSGSLTFAAGDTTATFTVPILDDSDGEGAETVNLKLSKPGGGAVIGAPSGAVLRIADNEPIIGFTGRWIGNGLEVERTGPADVTSRVDYMAVDGTATQGVDYAELSGTLTFTPGVRIRIIPIRIFSDTLTEGDETFTVHLSNAVRARLGQTQRQVVIKDNN